MAPAYTYRATAGVAGEITRPDDTQVESGIIDTALPPLLYGTAVKISNAGLVQAWAGTDIATAFAGIAVREAPSIAGSTAQAFGGSVPNPLNPIGVMVSGYVNVRCPVGTPIKNLPVAICVTAGGGKAVGDFGTVVDASNLLIPRLVWNVNGVDSNLVSEVRYL
jgi:hypothetical protein